MTLCSLFFGSSTLPPLNKQKYSRKKLIRFWYSSSQINRKYLVDDFYDQIVFMDVILITCGAKVST